MSDSHKSPPGVERAIAPAGEVPPTLSSRMEWLGLRQLVQHAAVSERTLRAWIHLPVDPLPAVRVSGKILVRRSQFDAWLERHRIRPLAEVDVDDIVRGVLEG